MDMEKEKVFNSAGWQAVNRIGILNENYHTLYLNYSDLIKEITRIETAEKPIILLFNNPNLNRYIFNFLASTTALIDSCRNTMSFYKETELYENHQKNITQIFAKNKETQFIKDLRNYQMHYKVIFPWLSKDEKVSYEVYKLKEFSKWTQLSKEFINEQDEYIPIKPLFQRYFKLLEPFYLNIFTILVKHHQSDFIETYNMAAKIKMAIPAQYEKFIRRQI